MSFIIIGHTESDHYFERDGTERSRDGSYDMLFFREPEEFIESWAQWKFFKLHEDITIILHGIPDYALSDEQDVEYFALEDKMLGRCVELKVKADEEKRLAQLLHEENNKVAIRLREHIERQRDLQQFNALKTKLGM